MSVFTDDDLKRLKEECERRRSYELNSADGLMIRSQMEALLARLEAADEVCTEYFSRSVATSHILPISESEAHAWKEYLASSGKKGGDAK